MVLEFLQGKQVNLPVVGAVSLTAVLLVGGIFFFMRRRKKSVKLTF